jgi:glutamate formiminotransferase / formiminotetrahydrofolate cyclodeaminase
MAARYGVSIKHTEIVGLVPQQALLDSAQWYLQIDDFKPEQVLEVRLNQVLTKSANEAGATAFLDELASEQPAPGGGSAAAYSGAMGASLVAMVARLTVGKKKYAEVESRMLDILAEAETLRAQLQAGVQKDADAFNKVMDAFRLPKDSDARANAIEQATHHAAEVPLETARLAARVLELAAEVATHGNSNAITDAGTAGSLAQTAIHAAGLNVKINANNVNDKDAAAGWLAELSQLENTAHQHIERLHQSIRERGQIEI